MKHNQKNLIIKIITTPYRAICKAKDFYIRSITECTTPSMYGGPARTFGNPISRSSSTSSFGSSVASEDLRELIRANSTARMGNLNNISRADLEMYIKQHMIMKQSSASPAIPLGSRKVPRSVSVGMGRIDEEMPVSSFPEVEELGTRKAKSDLMFPRSKSHAVTSSSKINRFS